MMNTSARHLTTFPCRRWQRHQSPTWFHQTLRRASVSVPTAHTSASTATTATTVGLVLPLVQSDNRESPARVVQLLPPAFTAAPGLDQDKSHSHIRTEQEFCMLYVVVLLHPKKCWLELRSGICAGCPRSFTPNWENQFFMDLALVPSVMMEIGKYLVKEYVTRYSALWPYFGRF